MNEIHNALPIIKKMKISQSMMKSLNDYIMQNECGLVFKAKYIDKTLSMPPTDAMKLGIYFEYMATGALPRNGVAPEAEMVYKGKPNEKMSADYERATASADFFKSLIQFWNIEIKEVGLVMETDKMKGIADLLVEWNGKPAIFDLKYTGLIDDKWSDIGWHKDFLSQKDNLLVQGVMYKLLAKEVYGIEDIDFYFWVFDTKNPINVRIIKEVVDLDKFDAHLSAVDSALHYIETTNKNKSWKPIPSLLKCSTCPLKPTCEHAVDYPLIEEVYY